jgi:hypothetical protein
LLRCHAIDSRSNRFSQTSLATLGYLQSRESHILIPRAVSCRLGSHIYERQGPQTRQGVSRHLLYSGASPFLWRAVNPNANVMRVD